MKTSPQRHRYVADGCRWASASSDVDRCTTLQDAVVRRLKLQYTALSRQQPGAASGAARHIELADVPISHVREKKNGVDVTIGQLARRPIDFNDWRSSSLTAFSSLVRPYSEFFFLSSTQTLYFIKRKQIKSLTNYSISSRRVRISSETGDSNNSWTGIVTWIDTSSNGLLLCGTSVQPLKNVVKFRRRFVRVIRANFVQLPPSRSGINSCEKKFWIRTAIRISAEI